MFQNTSRQGISELERDWIPINTRLARARGGGFGLRSLGSPDNCADWDYVQMCRAVLRVMGDDTFAHTATFAADFRTRHPHDSELRDAPT
jgi:hypothetical protein